MLICADIISQPRRYVKNFLKIIAVRRQIGVSFGCRKQLEAVMLVCQHALPLQTRELNAKPASIDAEIIGELNAVKGNDKLGRARDPGLLV